MNYKKIVAACVLVILGVAFLTASKTSLLYLWAQKSSAPRDQWYAAVCLVLVVPEVVSVARILWDSTLLVADSASQWPSLRVVLLGIFTVILESAALTFLTMEVAPSLPVYAVLFILNVLLLLQTLVDQWKPGKAYLYSINPSKHASDTMQCRIVNCVVAFAGLCGFILLAILLAVLKVADTAVAVSLVACLLSLSVVWSQPVRQYVLCAGTSSISKRQNVALLLGVFRVASLIGFSLLTAAVGTKKAKLAEIPGFVWTGLTQIHASYGLMVALVVHCCTSIVACMLSRVGAYYTATRSSIVVPTVTSTVVTSVLFLVRCVDGVNFDVGLQVCFIRHSDIAIYVISVFLYIIPFLAIRKAYFEPADILFRPEIENFFSFSYHSVCFEQNLYLNYNPFSLMFGECFRVGARRTRVFMCTTMYREADYEMEQLLRSLSKVSKSKRLKNANVYLESHIFLDNGADGCTLTEFALQLMSLVEMCFSVARTESTIHKTACGVQIHCILPGGMPLFLHLKDSSLVKAKKRWSQVMYMKYILEHRIKVTRDRDILSSRGSVRVLAISKDAGDKNGEILLQIRSLLKNNKIKDKSKPDTHDGSSINESRCGSEHSSDQGIDVTDEMSTISDASCHKEALKISDECQTGNSTPILRESNSYASLLSAHLIQGKINPAYVPDENEESPPKWLPEFVNKFLGASPMHMTGNGSIPEGIIFSPSDEETYSDPMFTITDGLPDIENSYTSIQVEVPQQPLTFDKQTYILATDADMLFNDLAVLDLVNVCNDDLRLGAACGRTYPMGKKINPIVWYQIFEYAKDFWMIKSAQNVIGSVMCCPGCFSLYRAEVIDDVVKTYSEPTTKAGDVFTKDTGEDRWMCTLMMMKGWMLRYSTYAVNSTYCPDNIGEFIKQRRRWILSDFANSFLVFRNLPKLMRNNGCFSFMYALYLAQLFIIVIFSPGTTVVMLTVGIELLTGAPYHITTPVMAMIFMLYGIACCVLSPAVQIRVTKVSIVVLGLSMAAVVIGAGVYVLIDMIKSINSGGLSLIEHYLLLALTGSVIYAALMHPSECYILIYGIVYLFYFPAMYMLLPLYALCNIVDQTWGTRDNQKAKVPKRICFPRIRRKKKKKTKNPGSCENLAEEPDAVSDQIKSLSPEEERFWETLVARLIGKDVNLGLGIEELVRGLRKLRFRIVVIVMITNLAWIIALSFFYLWSFSSGSQISAYGILSGVLYAFSFFIQIVGMTIYRVQDGVHRIGKIIYGKDLAHYVRSRDVR